jgi:hypothetical protein
MRASIPTEGTCLKEDFLEQPIQISHQEDMARKEKYLILDRFISLLFHAPEQPSTKEKDKCPAKSDP